MTVTNHPKRKLLRAELPFALDACAKFANRWARHDETCSALHGGDSCTCGYDLAVRTLAEVLAGRIPPDVGPTKALELIEQGQRVIP